MRHEQPIYRSTEPPRHEPLALRPAAAAEALGISERFLRRLTSEGAIPHARIGRAIVYRREVLNQWLAARESRGEA